MDKIGVGLIVKNEEVDLPECLNSALPFADHLWIVDTGSTDGTERVVQEFCERNGFCFVRAPWDGNKVESGKLCVYHTYTGASKFESGQWLLKDFSDARNRYVDGLEAIGAEWVFWLDADDVVLKPELVRALIDTPFDAFGFPIVAKAGEQGFIHHRLWRAHRGVRYEGSCHEYPSWPSDFRTSDTSIEILHKWTQHESQEPSIDRNLRILQTEYNLGRRKARALFYFANSLRDAGRYDEAIAIYDEYMQKPGFHMEGMYARLYTARCFRLIKNYDRAFEVAFQALAIDQRLAELWMELAYCYQDTEQHRDAIAFASCARRPMPPEALFPEENKYTDQPLRVMASSYEALGEKERALQFAGEVLTMLPEDHDVHAQVDRLTRGTTEVALHRPGAAGDIIMTLHLIEQVKVEYPDKWIVYYCSPAFAGLARLCRAVDEVRDAATYRPGHFKDFNLVGYPRHEGYPDKPMRRHLIDYFADELGVKTPQHGFDPDFERANLPEHVLYFQHLGAITIHIQAGWSPYKNWPVENWQEIVNLIRLEFPDEKIVQVGGADDPALEGVHFDTRGKYSLVETAFVVYHARLHLGIDSFTNHVTAMGETGTPAVILWGSTSAVGSGYPDNKNLSYKTPCSPCYREYDHMSADPRGKCPHDPTQSWESPKHPCMQHLSITYVWSVIRDLISAW